MPLSDFNWFISYMNGCDLLIQIDSDHDRVCVSFVSDFDLFVFGLTHLSCVRVVTEFRGASLGRVFYVY